MLFANFGAILENRISFGPEIAVDDGMLDCCVFSPRNLRDAMRIMWRVTRRDFRPDPSILYRKGTRFRIETEPVLTLQADGELLGPTPAGDHRRAAGRPAPRPTPPTRAVTGGASLASSSCRSSPVPPQRPPAVRPSDGQDPHRRPANRTLTSALGRSFERTGHDVLRAGTGEEAIAIVEGEHPAVVLLDVELPDMSGLEVLERTREQRPWSSC